MSRKRGKVISIVGGIIIAILTAILMYGTSVGPRLTHPKYEFVCIDQVEYFYSQVTQGPVAPHLKPDGRLYLCE